MKTKIGEGTSKYGPGVTIDLTGDEIAIAIDAYLVAHDVYVHGARTITVNGQLCHSGTVYVDPSGFVIHDGKKISGRGSEELTTKCQGCICDKSSCHICPETFKED